MCTMLIKVIWKIIKIVENMKYGLSRGKDKKQSLNHAQPMGFHISCVCPLLTWSLRDLHECLFGVESSYCCYIWQHAKFQNPGTVFQILFP